MFDLYGILILRRVCFNSKSLQFTVFVSAINVLYVLCICCFSVLCLFYAFIKQVLPCHTCKMLQCWQEEAISMLPPVSRHCYAAHSCSHIIFNENIQLRPPCGLLKIHQVRLTLPDIISFWFKRNMEEIYWNLQIVTKREIPQLPMSIHMYTHYIGHG